MDSFVTAIFHKFPQERCWGGSNLYLPEQPSLIRLEPRSLIYDNVLNSARSYAPVQNQRYRMELVDVDYDGPDSYTLADQKRAILEGRTLSRKLRGTWRMHNLEDESVVDEKRVTLGNVPYLSQRGTYIQNGTDYGLAHQMRLRPGVFARQKESGELESHINVSAGLGHRYFMDPETGVFRVQLGQARIPIVPLLQSLGVPEGELRKRWGNELFEANMKASDTRALKKIHQRIFRGKPVPEDTTDINTAIRQAFAEMTLDPDVTGRTLGEAHSTMGPKAIMASLDKLMRVHKGEEQPDDRDSLAYQTLMGPEDLFADRIRKSRGDAGRALWKATFQGNLQRMQPGLMDRAIRGTLLDQAHRVTRMGEGGIPSASSVPGEGFDADTEVFTSRGWIQWPDVEIHELFACQLNGRLEYHRARYITQKRFTGELVGIKTRTLDHLVTPNHRIWCRKYRGGSSLKRCGLAEWQFESAVVGLYKPRQFQIACLPYRGVDSDEWSLPPVKGARKLLGPFNIEDFAEFLGWYLSEGSIDSYALRERSKFHITITKEIRVKPDKVQEIHALLDRMYIPHSYQGHNFVFVNKQLGTYLMSMCGMKAKKRMPDEVFGWPLRVRQRLLNTIVAGDGHVQANGAITYHSTSQLLNRQFSRLAMTLGKAARERKVRVHPQESFNDCHSCGVLLSSTQGVTCRSQYDSSYYKQSYNGTVYCAEVPGGLLLVRRRKSVAMWSGCAPKV